MPLLTPTPRRSPAYALALAAMVLLPAGAALAQAPNEPLPLRRVGTIELPGPKGQRFDYLTVDADGRRLFSAHLSASQTYVIDLASESVTHTIADTPGVEGLAYVGSQKKLFTANSSGNTVGVVDLATMKVVKKVPTESKPDGIAYAPSANKVYVVNERARSVSAIDTRSDTTVATIRFDSETGVPGYDAGLNLVFVNLQDKNELAAIDPASDKTVGRYPIAGCLGNHGMDIDQAHHLAFIACLKNSRFVVFDLQAKSVLASFPLPLGADIVAFDAGLGRAYVPCAIGSIAVFQMDDPAHFRALPAVKAEPFIHTAAVDPVTHRLYVPEQQEGGTSVARMAVFEAVR
ncbi:MAG: hypothetical protein U1E56_14205 [Bauldia sp.]